jgi:hypothetical protein
VGALLIQHHLRRIKLNPIIILSIMGARTQNQIGTKLKRFYKILTLASYLENPNNLLRKRTPTGEGGLQDREFNRRVHHRITKKSSILFLKL